MNTRNKILGKNIKAERIRKDLTQAKLAEKINISESSLSLIERGVQSPSVFIAFDIAKVLNIDINDLLKDLI
jgi:putative transcriptional regulator